MEFAQVKKIGMITKARRVGNDRFDRVVKEMMLFIVGIILSNSNRKGAGGAV